MASLFSKPKIPQPLVANPQTDYDAAAIREAANAEAEALRKRRGMMASIANVGGIGGISSAPTILKAQLG